MLIYLVPFWCLVFDMFCVVYWTWSFPLLPLKYFYGAKCLIYIYLYTFHVKENSARLQWYSCARYKAPGPLVSSTGWDQSSLCDTLLSVCPSVLLSICKQFLLPHLLWGYLSQRLLYCPSLLALWCSCAPAIVIMILSPWAWKGGGAFSLYKSM